MLPSTTILRTFTASCCLWIGSTVFAVEAYSSDPTPPLRRIEILETNNTITEDNYKNLQLPPSIRDPKLMKLRTIIEKEVQLTGKSDLQTIEHVLEWVSLQWKHHPLNGAPVGLTGLDILEKAKKGERFRCVEYGLVFKDAMFSLGYVARNLNARTEDVAYGGFARGHAASEVWSNTYNKWIFVDPQFALYPTYQGTPINFAEMASLYYDGKFEEITFICSNKYLANNNISREGHIGQYKNFIQNYFAYMNIPFLHNGKPIRFALPLRPNLRPYLTMMGMPTVAKFFTNDPSKIYFPINRTGILFDYERLEEPSAIFEKFNITSNEDYLSKMPMFAAKPNYTLTLSHSMPWFRNFEVKLNQENWQVIKGNTVKWTLNDGLNTLQVRSVNQAGVAGPATYIQMYYGSTQVITSDAPSEPVNRTGEEARPTE